MMTGDLLFQSLYCYRAKYVRAIDGDTFELIVDHGMKIQSVQHVRLLGIDCHEIHGVKKDSEEYQKGIAARDRVDMLLKPYSYQKEYNHSYLYVKTLQDKTSFNRYIADVYILWDVATDVWISLTELLLREGHGVKL